MPPLTGLRSFPLAVNPASIVAAGYQGFDEAQQEQERAIRLALERLALQEQQRKAAELGRTPETATLTSPAIPGIAMGPTGAPPGGGQLLSLEEAPQGISPGVPAATETLTEYPRYETPPNWEARKRQAQARLDMEQAYKEADDRYTAGDEQGYRQAKARALGYSMDWVDPGSRGRAVEMRNKELDELARVRGFGVNEDFRRTGAARERFNANKGDLSALINLEMEAARVRDPHAKELADKWVLLGEQEYASRQVGPDQQAVGVIMKALREKRLAREGQGIALTPKVLGEIGLEIQREHPAEADRFDYLLFTGKGQIPLQYAKMFHPEIALDKDVEAYREVEFAFDKRPDGTPYTREEKDQIFNMIKKSKGTPAEQISRIKLNEARTQGQIALTESRQERARGVAGLTIERQRALEESLVGYNKLLADLPTQRWTDEERKEQERELKGHIKAVHDELDERDRLRRAATGPTPPRPPTSTPTWRPETQSRYDKAKKLWEAERRAGREKGAWTDPAVARKYYEQAGRVP